MQSCFPACSHGEYVRLTGLAVSHIQCTKTCKKVTFLNMVSVPHLAEYVWGLREWRIWRDQACSLSWLVPFFLTERTLRVALMLFISVFIAQDSRPSYIFCIYCPRQEVDSIKTDDSNLHLEAVTIQISSQGNMFWHKQAKWSVFWWRGQVSGNSSFTGVNQYSNIGQNRFMHASISIVWVLFK